MTVGAVYYDQGGPDGGPFWWPGSLRLDPPSRTGQINSAKPYLEIKGDEGQLIYDPDNPVGNDPYLNQIFGAVDLSYGTALRMHGVRYVEPDPGFSPDTNQFGGAELEDVGYWYRGMSQQPGYVQYNSFLLNAIRLGHEGMRLTTASVGDYTVDGVPESTTEDRSRIILTRWDAATRTDVNKIEIGSVDIGFVAENALAITTEVGTAVSGGLEADALTVIGNATVEGDLAATAATADDLTIGAGGLHIADNPVTGLFKPAGAPTWEAGWAPRTTTDYLFSITRIGHGAYLISGLIDVTAAKTITAVAQTIFTLPAGVPAPTAVVSALCPTNLRTPVEVRLFPATRQLAVYAHNAGANQTINAGGFITVNMMFIVPDA
jgi:hypothetical protein